VTALAKGQTKAIRGNISRVGSMGDLCCQIHAIGESLLREGNAGGSVIHWRSTRICRRAGHGSRERNQSGARSREGTGERDTAGVAHSPLTCKGGASAHINGKPGVVQNGTMPRKSHGGCTSSSISKKTARISAKKSSSERRRSCCETFKGEFATYPEKGARGTIG